MNAPESRVAAAIELLRGADLPASCIGMLTAIIGTQRAALPGEPTPGVDIAVELANDPITALAAIAWLSGYAAGAILELAESDGIDVHAYLQRLALRQEGRS